MRISSQKYMLRQLKKEWVKNTWETFKCVHPLDTVERVENYPPKWEEWKKENTFEEWLEDNELLEDQ